MAATILPGTPTSVVSSAAADCSTPSMRSADLTSLAHTNRTSPTATSGGLRVSHSYQDAVVGPSELQLMGAQSHTSYAHHGHSSNKLLHTVPVASSHSRLSSSSHAPIRSPVTIGTVLPAKGDEMDASSRYPLNTSAQFTETSIGNHSSVANASHQAVRGGGNGGLSDTSISNLSLWGTYPTPLFQYQPSADPNNNSNNRWASAVPDHGMGLGLGAFGQTAGINPRHFLTKAVASSPSGMATSEEGKLRPYPSIRDQNSNTPFLRHSYSKSSISRQSSFRNQRAQAHSHSHLPPPHGTPTALRHRAGSPGASVSTGGIFGGFSASNKMDVVSLSMRASPSHAARSPARQKSFSQAKANSFTSHSGGVHWSGLPGVPVTSSVALSSAFGPGGLVGVHSSEDIQSNFAAEDEHVKQSVLNVVRNRPAMMLTVFLQDLYSMIGMADLNGPSKRRGTDSPSHLQLSQYQHQATTNLAAEQDYGADGNETGPVLSDLSCDLGYTSPSAVFGVRGGSSEESPELARPPGSSLAGVLPQHRQSIASGQGEGGDDANDANEHEPPTHSSASLQQMLGSCFASSQRILTQPAEPLVPQMHSDGVTRCVDNEDGNLVMYVGMVLLGWLEVISELGSGSFGQVVLCKDLRTCANAASMYQKERDYKYYYTSPEYCDIEVSEGTLVAVKVFGSNPTCESQSYIEAQIMQDLVAQQQQEVDDEGNPVGEEVVEDPRKGSVCRILASGATYGHHCIAMERYACNLYEYLVSTGMDGLPISVVRHIARQSLLGLEMVHDKGYVHCDIKPENIMVKYETAQDVAPLTGQAFPDDEATADDASPVPMEPYEEGNAARPPVEIAVIDFSASCEAQPATYFEYIQSRYYRAPEAIVAAPYSAPMDIWSLGCVLAEVLIGRPLLPGANNFHQLNRIIEMFGPLPSWLLDQGTNTGAYYHLNRPKRVSDSISANGTTQQYYANPPGDAEEQVLGVGGEDDDGPLSVLHDNNHTHNQFDAQGSRMEISSSTPIYGHMTTASATPADPIGAHTLHRPSITNIEDSTPAGSVHSPVTMREQTTEYFSSNPGFSNGSGLQDNHSFAATEPPTSSPTIPPTSAEVPSLSRPSVAPVPIKPLAAHHIFAESEGIPSSEISPESATHTIMTEEEFCEMHGCEPAPWLRYLKYDTLQEIIQHLRLSDEEQLLSRRALVQQRKVLYQFLKGMLQVDPTKRMTAAELLAHPFITQQYGGMSETPTKGSATRSSGGTLE